jgi:hypothetical protein
MTLKFLALRGAPYVYDISRLRVKVCFQVLHMFHKIYAFLLEFLTVNTSSSMMRCSYSERVGQNDSPEFGQPDLQYLMFCWPCVSNITNTTNLIHTSLSFSLLFRFKALTCFRHKNTVYRVFILHGLRY